MSIEHYILKKKKLLASERDIYFFLINCQKNLLAFAIIYIFIKLNSSFEWTMKILSEIQKTLSVLCAQRILSWNFKCRPLFVSESINQEKLRKYRWLSVQNKLTFTMYKTFSYPVYTKRRFNGLVSIPLELVLNNWT